MKRILLSLATALITVLGISAQNTYNMVIEMNNGTKINIGPNDIKNMSFVDGDLTISGESIDDIKKEIADLKLKLDEQKSCECSKEIEALKQEIANLNTSDIKDVINVLELQIKSLMDEVAALKSNSGNNDSQEGGKDEQGDGNDNQGGNQGNTDYSSALIGTWYEYHSDYICALKITADKCYYGEWSIGSEEKFAGTGASYTVGDGTITIIPPSEPSVTVNYSLSDDGKTLTIFNSYHYDGTYTKQ